MRKVILFKDKLGREPFNDWFECLPDLAQAKVDTYIKRIRLGGSRKNIQALGEGVFELKINYGPGLRIYFGQEWNKVVLLLLGGDKKSQKSDIIKAKAYWIEYEKIQKLR